jgi:hypothetical protein
MTTAASANACPNLHSKLGASPSGHFSSSFFFSFSFSPFIFLSFRRRGLSGNLDEEEKRISRRFYARISFLQGDCSDDLGC